MNIGIPLYVNPVEVKVCCGFPSVVIKGYRLLWTMSTLNLLSFVRCPTLFCGDLFELFYSIAEAISPEAFVQGEDDQGCDGARSDGSGAECDVLDHGVAPLGGSLLH